MSEEKDKFEHCFAEQYTTCPHDHCKFPDCICDTCCTKESLFIDRVTTSFRELDELKDKPRRTTAKDEREDCKHDWVSINNQHCSGMWICQKCRLVRGASEADKSTASADEGGNPYPHGTQMCANWNDPTYWRTENADLHVALAEKEKEVEKAKKDARFQWKDNMIKASQHKEAIEQWIVKAASAEAQPKDGERICPHMYEDDSHGIEMIKGPSGKEWAIGGTDTEDRWTHDPWCGGRIVEVTERPVTLKDCLGHMKKGIRAEEPKALEMFENCTYGKMTDRTKAMLKVLASYGGLSYEEIERAYRRLKSLDYLVMCTDNVGSLNRSLADCVNDFEIRGPAPDESVFVIRPTEDDNFKVYERCQPGKEELMACGNLAFCRQYIRDRSPREEAEAMKTLMALEAKLKETRAIVVKRDREILLLNQILDARNA